MQNILFKLIVTNKSIDVRCGLGAKNYLIQKGIEHFLCPRHSKNGGGALSVTPVLLSVRPCVRPSVRPLSKYVVRSITFERLHGFNSNLVCLYTIAKHKSSSI